MKHKKLVLVVLLMSMFTFAQAQVNFQGQIVYHEEFIDNNIPKLWEYLAPFDTIKVSFGSKYQKMEFIQNVDTNLYSKPHICIGTDSMYYFIFDRKDNILFYVKKDEISGIIARKTFVTNEIQKILGYDCKKYTVKDSLVNGYVITRYYWIAKELRTEQNEEFTISTIEGCALKKETVVEHTSGKFKINRLTAVKVTKMPIVNELNDMLKTMTLRPQNPERFESIAKKEYDKLYPKK